MNHKPVVLFVNKKSIYKDMGCDCYDQERNALTYSGSAPVIAHPPCRLWSKLRHFSTANPVESLLGLWTVGLVRLNGGVLEHPAYSKLWSYMGLPLPNRQPDRFGGFTISVNQSWFGHPCKKQTWIYIVGINAEDLPDFDKSENETLFYMGKPGLNKAAKKEVPTAWRSATPPLFASFLVDILGQIDRKKSGKGAPPQLACHISHNSNLH